jgi:hypothetical protein
MTNWSASQPEWSFFCWSRCCFGGAGRGDEIRFVSIAGDEIKLTRQAGYRPALDIVLKRVK